MALKLSLPPLDLHPGNPPETRPAQVAVWLDQALTRNAIEAARVIGDALAATNAVAVGDARRLDLAEKFWRTADILWPRLELYFASAAHPLHGEALDAAKATLFLAQELFVAYKRVLEHEADKRVLFGGNRALAVLVHRCMQCAWRILVNSYVAYAPVLPRTWLDVHRIYAFAHERGVHQRAIVGDDPAATPERVYVQAPIPTVSCRDSSIS
jgi:hypothetical protein